SPSAAQVQAHLQSLPALAPTLTFPQGNVTVLGGQSFGQTASQVPYTIIFNGALANTPEPLLASANQAGTNTTTNTFAAVTPGITVDPRPSPGTGTPPNVQPFFAITATNVQTPINPSVNTEVQRITFTGTT